MAGEFADQQLAAWVAEQTTLGDLDVEVMRAGTIKRAATRAPGPAMDTVTDLTVGDSGLRGRVYRPAAGPLPVILHLHGGGWTIGNLDTHDRLCRRLADRSGTAVMALDYRSPPSTPGPPQSTTRSRPCAGSPRGPTNSDR